MRKRKSVITTTAFILLCNAAPGLAQSTLPVGVKVISPQAATSVIDPEQLDERTPGHLVQDLHAAFGAHGARAVHTKGHILLGTFTPSAEAGAISQAGLFKGTEPVIVRFSDFTGIPDIPDTDPNGQPRGFAVKFLMDDGSNLDLVNHSFNGFPTPTAVDFGDLLEAIGASGSGVSKPTPLDSYLGAHPAAKHFLTTQTPPPESWATTDYYGVNAYQMTNTKGRSVFVRFRFVPLAGEHFLDAAALAKKLPDYLSEEIVQRVKGGPIEFTWYAELAVKGDDIADPSTPWPQTRKLIKLGTISIDRDGPNTPLADASLLFLPGTTPLGISPADPMLTIRNATYPVSFAERR
jgi:catalase